MRSFFLALIWMLLSFQALPQQVHSVKTLNTVRVTQRPVIDGQLDEPMWANVETATDFIQKAPVPGRVPTYQSEVKIVYDDAAIYIGAKLYYESKTDLYREITPRDEQGSADYFIVYFDTYHDKLNSFDFAVSAAGVQRDKRRSPGNIDVGWNAGWFSEVSVHDKYWIAEIEIPLSALRFPNTSKQVWGLNFYRTIAYLNETTFWNEYNPEVNGFVNQFGELHGISDIKSPLRLAIAPYVSSYYNHYADISGGVYQASTSLRGGMDIKYGINDAYTLDMMLIPDFGNVVSDNTVLNLSPFEVFHSENRAFFTEGTDLFQKGNYVYSRRIGGRPVDYGKAEDFLQDGEALVRNERESSIINATKVSGRSKNGLGVGFLNAVTNRSYAVAEAESGEQRKMMTSPLVNYNVLVLDQTLPNNSYVSLINTNVQRGEGYYDANVFAGTFELQNNASTLELSGRGAMSVQSGDEIYHENEARGYHSSLALGKIGGNFQFGARYHMESEHYNPNDLGFMKAPNDNDIYAHLMYSQHEPVYKFINYSARLNIAYERLFNPNVFEQFNIGATFNATFKNYLHTRISLEVTPFEHYDFHEPRVEGMYLIEPAFKGTGVVVSTDRRKKIMIEGWANYFDSEEKGRDYLAVGFEPRFRISDRWSVNTALESESANNDIGYVHNDDDDVHMGVRDMTTIINSLSTKYSFNKNMDLFFKMRHYWSNAEYKEFKELDDTGRLRSSDYSGGHDVNFNAFNIDMIYTWVFSPASELSLIWKNTISSDAQILQDSYFDNLNTTVQAPQENSLSIRVLYYLDYMMFTRNKRG